MIDMKLAKTLLVSSFAGLLEVRSALPSRRIARLIFCAEEGELFVLHGFIKKTQKTPAVELGVQTYEGD